MEIILAPSDIAIIWAEMQGDKKDDWEIDQKEDKSKKGIPI